MTHPFELRITRRAAGSATPEDARTLSLEVASFHGREALGEPFRYHVEVRRPDDDLDPEAWLGATGALRLRSAHGEREVRGLVWAIERRGGDDELGSLVVELVAPIEQLSRRWTSRLFQDRRLGEVVRSLVEPWGIPVRFHFVHAHDPIPYVAQYEETDLEFLERLLAAHGVTFAIEPPAPGAAEDELPTLVVFDSAEAYRSLSVGPEGLELRHAPAATAQRGGELVVTSWSERRALAPTHVSLREVHADNPRADLLRQRTHAGEDDAPLAAFHEYLPRHPHSEARDDASLALEQARRDAHLLHGETPCRLLAPGALIRVGAFGASPRPFAVVGVSSEGRDPRFSPTSTPDEHHAHFEVVPAETLLRPRRRKPRVAPPLDRATVVGGLDGAPPCDALGRVRVRFAWNVEGDAPTAWLRVAQAWVGPGYGASFVPRAGTEVLVGYLGGDIDRPVVVGSVPNAEAPPPFALPAEAHRSGLVTRSTSGDGGSSLVFDDAAGRERVSLDAQRDLSLAAGGLAELRSALDLQGRTGRDLTLAAARDATLSARGDCSVSAEGRMHVRAERSFELGSSGLASLSAEDVTVVARGALETRAGARHELHAPIVATRAETLEAVVRAHALGVVGRPDAPGSAGLHVFGAIHAAATGAITLEATRSLVLRVGETHVEIGEHGVRIQAEEIRLCGERVVVDGGSLSARAPDGVRIEGGRVVLVGREARLALETDALLSGARVALGAKPDAGAHADPAPPLPPATHVRLVDQDGSPLAGARWVLRLEDGSTRTGRLDDEGRATVTGLSGSATIDFPDLPTFEPA